MAAKFFFKQLLRYIHIISLIYQWVPQYVIHWSFSSHLLLFNTRGLCRLLHHHLPTSSQLYINHTNREVDHDCLDAHMPARRNLYRHCAPYKQEGIQECSLLILYLIIVILMEYFFKYKLSTIFYYIRYISVYIQSIYCIKFSEVCANNLNWVILYSVRPPFWK